jgi:hypothetical protein
MNESIFISYARKDGAAAKKIVGGLRKAGFKILAVKSSTTDPAELKKELAAKINRADCVLALISSDAMKTKRWHSEVRFATKRDKLIVPVLLEGDKMPPELEDDVYPLEDVDGELAELVDYIQDLFDEDADDDDPFSVLDDDDDDEEDARLAATPRKKAASGRSLWVAPGGGPSNFVLGLVVFILVVVVSVMGVMVMMDQSGVTVPSDWTRHQAGNISVAAPPNWLSFDEQDLLSGNMAGLDDFAFDPSDFAFEDMEDATLEIVLTDPETGAAFMVASGVMPEEISLADLEDELAQDMEGMEDMADFGFVDIPAGESFKMALKLEMFGGGIEMVLYVTPVGRTLYMAIWMAAIGEEAPPEDMLDKLIQSYQIG